MRFNTKQLAKLRNKSTHTCMEETELNIGQQCMHFPFSHLCVITWWLEERRPLALVQVTWGGGFPGAKQLSSRLWPSWTSAIDGWMLTAEEL